MKNPKLSLFVLLALLFPFLVISQTNDLKTSIDEINYILNKNVSTTVSFDVKTTIEYYLENGYNELILREKTYSSFENQTKEYILPYSEIKIKGIIIRTEIDFIELRYGNDDYFRYDIYGLDENSEGLEPSINLYLGQTTDEEIDLLYNQFDELFISISGGISTYSDDQSNEYNYYDYSQAEPEEYYDDSYYYQDYSNDDYNYYADYDYEVENDSYSDYYSSENSKESEYEYYDEDGDRVYDIEQAYYFRYVGYDEEGKLYAVDSYGSEIPYKAGYLASRDPNNMNNDVRHGEWYWYYENGDLHLLAMYENGQLIDNEYIEFDELGNATLIFDESFKDNRNEWRVGHESSSYAGIQGGSLVIESKENYRINRLIRYKVDPVNDFIIESEIKLLSGDGKSGQGIVWGFKDWDNYYSFRISSGGYYEIVAFHDGLELDISDGWVKSEHINQNYDWNKIQLNKYGNEIIFSLNGQMIEKHEFYAFKGNYIGFVVGPNRKIKVDNLTIKQKLGNESDYSSKGKGTESAKGEYLGNGTGFFIDVDGYIATNYHVIENANVIDVEFIRNGERVQYSAKIVQSDKQNDLAIIKINDYNFVPFNSIPYNFKTGVSDVGTNVFALGYPWALSGMGTEIKFTDGKLSSKTGFDGDITTYQMTTPVQGGNSGGPLFDYDGNLIGINTSKLKSEEIDNVSYAIKSSYLNNLVDALPTYVYLPHDTSIADETLTEKIKILSPYVVLIKIK